MLDIEMAKSLDSIVEEIESGCKKLESWCEYYADEEATFHSKNLTEGYSDLMKGIRRNALSVRHNVINLHMAQAIMGLYGLASIADEQD